MDLGVIFDLKDGEKKMMGIKHITFRRNKKGLPCMWEKNKEFISMKRFSYIFDIKGNRKIPLYTKDNGDALVPITYGDLFLKIFIDGAGIGATILRFLNIDAYSNDVAVEVVKRLNSSDKEWIINQDTVNIKEDVLKNISNELKKINLFI